MTEQIYAVIPEFWVASVHKPVLPTHRTVTINIDNINVMEQMIDFLEEHGFRLEIVTRSTQTDANGKRGWTFCVARPMQQQGIPELLGEPMTGIALETEVNVWLKEFMKQKKGIDMRF